MSQQEQIITISQKPESGRLWKWLTGKTATQLGGLLLIIIVWEIIFRARIVSELLFPSPLDVLAQFWHSAGDLSMRVGVTLSFIVYAMAIALFLSFLLTFLSMKSQIVASIMEMILAMMHPLPSVALLPLLIIWFGLGPLSLLIVVLNSALWPIFLNAYTGFRTVHQTYIEVGRNIGLKGLKLFWHVILPSTLPYLITGFEIAWARSWRAAIAVELVFGAATTAGGIGWTIYMSYFDMEAPLMVAAIFTIALVGVLAEKLGMETLENKTILKWGMIQKTETMGAQ
ncbi:MAG: ABC transporter permease [Desulfobacteraceae bacterium]|nr:ABC transporter permease [Desulfobacteraceae bacterium]